MLTYMLLSATSAWKVHTFRNVWSLSLNKLTWLAFTMASRFQKHGLKTAQALWRKCS